MGNQQKKDEKRAKRKKDQARQNQIRQEQASAVRKAMVHSFLNDTALDLVRRFIHDGRVSEETTLYKHLKEDVTFKEMQSRVLYQIQLQANDPRWTQRMRGIPARVYICKDASSVATLLVSPLVLIKTRTPLISAAKAFYEMYAREGGARFVCYVFGVTSHPVSEHFGIVTGPSDEMEIFLISGGKWNRIGHGEVPEGLVASMSDLLLERSEEAPREDSLDFTILEIATGRMQPGANPVDVYADAASGVAKYVEPIGGELLARIEDWVTQQAHTIQRMEADLDDASNDLTAARRRAVDLEKQIRRANTDLAAARAQLAAKRETARMVAPAPAPVRPLRERMADIFLGG